MNHKQQAVAEIAAQIKGQGFRPFIAENGDYGFFTDSDGSKVVSFGHDLGGIHFSGNYKTSAPQTTGTGWRMTDSAYGKLDCKNLFAQSAPQWAIRGATWRHTTLAEYLKTYQPSSKFVEFCTEVQA